MTGTLGDGASGGGELGTLGDGALAAEGEETFVLIGCGVRDCFQEVRTVCRFLMA